MGKPISFNKRELEKKREQKRQEKQKRKEERKANSGSMDDMIAYVDENGVITSTPPDLTNRQEIDASSISISTPQKEETEESALKGRVEHFNEGKGYGFIKDVNNTEKYFFHVSQVSENIKEGDLVLFELEKGQRGLAAVRIVKYTDKPLSAPTEEQDDNTL